MRGKTAYSFFPEGGVQSAKIYVMYCYGKAIHIGMIMEPNAPSRLRGLKNKRPAGL
jgi:hypothetical protein